ncbi:MAG: GIY-YIG nuclease family protein, partial [Patescibacteria group bacterium]
RHSSRFIKFKIMFYTYILKSEKNDSYYIGSCKDINKRIDLHNGGYVKSTKRYIPWKVVYNEEYKTLLEARKRESQIKSWKKRSMIEKLFKIL